MKAMYRHWHERKNKCDVEVNYYDSKEECIKGALKNWGCLTISERKITFKDFIEEVDVRNDDEWISSVMCIVDNGNLQDGYDYYTRDGLLREESGAIE